MFDTGVHHILLVSDNAIKIVPMGAPYLWIISFLILIRECTSYPEAPVSMKIMVQKSTFIKAV